MGKNIYRSFIISIVLCLSVSLALVDDARGQQKSFLWQAQSSTTTVYLLGSIHMLKPNNYPLNPAIERAFDRSGTLAVEANINDTSKLDLQKLVDSAFYPEGSNLARHVSSFTYDSVSKQTGKLGLPLELVDRQKPWFLGMMLEALELARLGFDPQYGIDVYFLTKAQGRKRIAELESLDEQINLLSSFSDSEQESFLLYTLRNLDLLGSQVNDLIRAWTAGDTKSFESIVAASFHEDPKLAPVIRKLVDDRNRNMVSKIEGYLRTRETYFVVVGAGHLVGDKGIIKALRARGYTVQQL
jgi:uncharacterized protein